MRYEHVQRQLRAGDLVRGQHVHHVELERFRALLACGQHLQRPESGQFLNDLREALPVCALEQFAVVDLQTLESGGRVLLVLLLLILLLLVLLVFLLLRLLLQLSLL